MKKKLIIAALVILALTLLTRRYNLIEKNDVLPAEVQSLLGGGFSALAQETGEQKYLIETVQKPREYLEKGDRGEQVAALQKRLYELGFLSDTTDGIFGDETESAVSALRGYLQERESERAQRAESRRADSLRDTRAALMPQYPGHAGETLRRNRLANQEMRRVLAPQETPRNPEPGKQPAPDGTVSAALWAQMSGEGFLSEEESLQRGAQGSRVARMQKRLQSLGYHLGAVDGDFGGATGTSLSAFQKYNGLPVSGVADRETMNALYSGHAQKAKIPSHPYLLRISVDRQRVYAYEWNVMDQDYTSLARTMICSTGLNETPTPKGTFTNTTPVVRWGYFPKFDCWAQYLYRINGSILFHSVIYDAADESTVRWGSVNNLGSKASHGCVRLTVEDARWLYNNCPAGTTVVVY